MKKLIYSFSIVLALIVFGSVSAKAATIATTTTNNSGGLIGDVLDLLGLGSSGSTSGSGSTGSTSSTDCNTSTSQTSTKLPINNGVVFLTIAGMAIGIVTIRKSKMSLIAAGKY